MVLNDGRSLELEIQLGSSVFSWTPIVRCSSPSIFLLKTEESEKNGDFRVVDHLRHGKDFYVAPDEHPFLSMHASMSLSLLILVNTVLLRGCVLRQRRLILLLAGLYLLYICIEKIRPCILAGQSVYGNHLQTGVCSHGVCPFPFAVYKKQMLFICVFV